MKVIDTYNAIVGAAVAVLSYIFGDPVCIVLGI